MATDNRTLPPVNTGEFPHILYILLENRPHEHREHALAVADEAANSKGTHL